MTWQLSAGGQAGWLIKKAETGELVASICHCDLATARILASAQEIREALELAEIADILGQPDYDPHKAIKMMEARGDYETGWLDNDKAVREYRYRARIARQRALRLAAGTGEER